MEHEAIIYQVQCLLEESTPVARQRSVVQSRQRKYSCYSPEERNSVGKYAAETGATWPQNTCLVRLAKLLMN